MKILILGANGQIGSELCKVLNKNYKIEKITRNKLNYYNLNKVKKFLLNRQYNLLINAAAYTQVDQAEIEKNKATTLNAKFPKLLSEIVKIKNIPLIHYSTDYVFSGKSKFPYKEDSKPNPINYYGKTKLQGDLAIIKEKVKGYILRVSWVYGNKDHSFLNKIQNQINKKKQLHVVNDQFGTPTSSTFIAKITKKLIDRKKFNQIKIYNLSPKGKCSWFDFTNEYLSQKKITHPLVAISTDNIQQKAKRPQRVKLNSSKLEKYLKIKFLNWKGVLKKNLYER